jgi:phosphate transport system protein
MNQIFEREREKLEEQVLRLAGDVELRLGKVLEAIEARDKGQLQMWMERDREIDEREVEIEEDCLKILALHQPLARDLRYIIAALKLNNDLERIGDIVVNIADRGVRLMAFPPVDLQNLIFRMGDRTRKMVKMSLDSLCGLDVGMAKAVIAADDEVDALNVQVIHAVIDRAKTTEAGLTEALLLIHSMARDLERIGDHATNIAEDVAYLVDGTILRHQRKE